MAESGKGLPYVGYGDTGTKDAARVDAQNYIDAGKADPTAVGGIPDYTALAQAVQQLAQQRVSLPPDVTAAMDTAALDQLGNNEAFIATQGGPVAAAQRAISSDEAANVATSGNLTATRKSAVKANQDTGDMAQKEAQQAGQQSLSATGQAAANRLNAYVMQGQIHHANLSLQNQAQAMQLGLDAQQQRGIQAARQAANNAQASLNAAALSNDQAAFGNYMGILRGGLSALGTGAAVASQFNSGGSLLASDYANPGTTGSENGNPYIDQAGTGAGVESGRQGTAD